MGCRTRPLGAQKKSLEQRALVLVRKRRTDLMTRLVLLVLALVLGRKRQTGQLQRLVLLALVLVLARKRQTGQLLVLALAFEHRGTSYWAGTGASTRRLEIPTLLEEIARALETTKEQPSLVLKRTKDQEEEERPLRRRGDQGSRRRRPGRTQGLERQRRIALGLGRTTGLERTTELEQLARAEWERKKRMDRLLVLGLERLL
jgi:hypothetical protein